MTTLSIANHLDQQFCIILDTEGVCRERSAGTLNRASVIEDIATGEIEDAAFVIEFNPTESNSRDISEDVAREALKALDARGVIEDGFDVPAFIKTYCPDYLDKILQAVAEDAAEEATYRKQSMQDFNATRGVFGSASPIATHIQAAE